MAVHPVVNRKNANSAVEFERGGNNVGTQVLIKKQMKHGLLLASGGAHLPESSNAGEEPCEFCEITGTLISKGLLDFFRESFGVRNRCVNLGFRPLQVR